MIDCPEIYIYIYISLLLCGVGTGRGSGKEGEGLLVACNLGVCWCGYGYGSGISCLSQTSFWLHQILASHIYHYPRAERQTMRLKKKSFLLLRSLGNNI